MSRLQLQLPGSARMPSAAKSAAFGAAVSEPKRIRAIARESARRDRCGGEKGAARHEYGSDETLRPAGGRHGGKNPRPAGGKYAGRYLRPAGERRGGKASGPLARSASVGTPGPLAAGTCNES